MANMTVNIAIQPAMPSVARPLKKTTRMSFMASIYQLYVVKWGDV